MHRRDILKSTASVAVAAGLTACAGTVHAAEERRAAGGKEAGPFIVTRDGVRLFYRDWGTGKPVVFLSGWALTSDMWSYQMLPLSEEGLRCIAFDRRGHGRSSDPGRGFDIDTLADDLAAVLEALDLREVTLVGHSMASAEMVRYLSRHGTRRIARVLFLAPITPFLLKTDDNPDGIDGRLFEQTRALWRHDFPKWLTDNERPFVTPETSDGMIEWIRGMMLQCSMKALMECNRAFIGTDFRPELRQLTVPALVIHGDMDASAPLELTGRRTAALISGARLEVYAGAPHGLFVTHLDRLNHDLLAFARG